MSSAERTIYALHTASALAVCLAHALMFFVAVYPLLTLPAMLVAVIGVEAFLVLSGYLIGHTVSMLNRGEVSASRFFMQSAGQTLPRYFFFYAINLSLLYALTKSTALPQLSFVWLGAHLISPAHSNFFPESWVLAVEFWFVVSIILTVTVSSKIRLHPLTRERLLLFFLFVVVVVSPVARAWATARFGWSIDEGVRKITLFRFDAVAIGVFAAREASRLSSLRAAYATGGLLAVGGAMYIALLSVRNSSVGGPMLLAPATNFVDVLAASFALSSVTIGCAVLIVVFEQRSRSNANSPIIFRTIGAPFVAHSLLLCHLPLLLVVHRLFPSVHAASPSVQVLVMLVWAGFTIAFAFVYCRVFETPLARCGVRLLQRAW